jgi:hypothetical protein
MPWQLISGTVEIVMTPAEENKAIVVHRALQAGVLKIHKAKKSRITTFA